MRLKSNAVWHSLPGVEAVYQPIGAPSAVDALMNVGRTDALGNHRMAGRYTATGVLPTWSAARGWAFNGTSQYLMTGVSAIPGDSVLVFFANLTNGDACLFSGSGLDYTIRPNRIGKCYYSKAGGGAVETAPTSEGVIGYAGFGGYKNGAFDATLPTGATNGGTYTIGASNIPSRYIAATILAVVLASRPFSPAEMWLASRQMAYCEQNPDWNAWSRRRMYFYAPSAAAFQAAWAARTNRLIGGGL